MEDSRQNPHFDEQPFTDGPRRPGDNPNLRNARGRKGPRPRTQNGQPSSGRSNRLNWVDPLPVVDPAPALGMEPVPADSSAGELDLDFGLPGTIARPFAEVVDTLGDRLNLPDSDKTRVARAVESQSYFKAARQLFSTMLEHEKIACQQLKAVYYDSTPVPAHMAAALSIIGHIDSKLGKVVVRNAPTLFKQWIVKGLQVSQTPGISTATPAESLVWPDADSYSFVQRKARLEIERLTSTTFEVQVGGANITVSPPRLVDQTPEEYYNKLPTQMPNYQVVRDLVALLRMDLDTYRRGTIGITGHTFATCLSRIGLVPAGNTFSLDRIRTAFEDWVATYLTRSRHHLEAIFRTAPPPAGASGFGAQLVSSERTAARLAMPLSDSDIAMGFTLSPCREFSFSPSIVAYSRRDRSAMLAQLASADGRMSF